jgi:hypothetical protein
MNRKSETSRVGGGSLAPDSTNAPFIYFDMAPSYGVTSGILGVTLEAVRTMRVENNIVNDRVVTAHLRMSLEAAKQLRAALDGAILIASPPEGKMS